MSVDPNLVYIEAVDWLAWKSKWTRKEVMADGESAGWFVAQTARTDEDKELAHSMGRIVSRGRPQ